MGHEKQKDLLLASALKEAMDEELKGIPSIQKLQKLHRFSDKFHKSMQDVIAQQESHPKKVIPFTGHLARMAASIVLVVALGAAGIGVLSCNGSKGMGSDAADEFEVAIPEEPVTPTLEGEVTESMNEAAALGWQEELLAESKKADELVSWHLNWICDDNTFVVSTETVEKSSDEGNKTSGKQNRVRISELYEVYFDDGSTDWLRVYKAGPEVEGLMLPFTGSMDACYDPKELGMTRPGCYRMVRRVNEYRQVLQLKIR